MSRHSICTLALALMIATGQLFAQVKPAAPPQAPQDPLAPVAWFVGGDWVSEVKDNSDGSVTHVDNRIRWSPNHQAIVFNVEFNGKPHYDGFYAYNPASKKIEFFYTNSEGQLTIGTATPDADSKTLHQEFDIMHPDGTTEHLRSTIERDGNDAYWFSVLMSKSGNWEQVFRIHYVRKPE